MAVVRGARAGLGRGRAGPACTLCTSYLRDRRLCPPEVFLDLLPLPRSGCRCKSRLEFCRCQTQV